jgi:hypothetical protein
LSEKSEGKKGAVVVNSINNEMTVSARMIGLLLAAFLTGCASTPKIDYDQLPYFTYSPMSESGVVDRRDEFAQIFCDQLRSGIEPEYADQECGDFLHMESEPAESAVPAEIDVGQPLRFVFVPGFLGDCLQSYTTPFQNSRQLLEDAGFETDLLMVGGRASSAHNAELIAAWLEVEERQSGPPIVLVGYSKGIPDILETIVSHPEAMHRVAAVVSVAGVVNGSPIASDQSGFMESFIENLPMSDCDSDNEDGSAIESLSYEYRQRWLQQHPIETHIRFFSVVPFGNIDQMSAAMKSSYRKLRHMDPRNDGQVIYRDAILPDSELLAYVRADHLAVALPVEGGLAGIIIDKNEYPRGVLLTSIVIAVQRWL